MQDLLKPMSTERCEFKKENGQSNVPTPTELESNLVPNVIRDVLSGNNTCVLYKNLPLRAEAHRHTKKYLHGKVQQQAGGQGSERLINRSNQRRHHCCRGPLRRNIPTPGTKMMKSSSDTVLKLHCLLKPGVISNPCGALLPCSNVLVVKNKVDRVEQDW